MASLKSLVPQHYDEDAGLHFIKGSRYILFENGVIVPRKEFDARFENKKSLSQLVIEAMRSPENCGWDYKNAVETTYLERKKGEKKMELAPTIPDLPSVDVVGEVEEKPVKPAASNEAVAPEPVKSEAPTQAPGVAVAKNAFIEFMRKPYTDVIIMLTAVGILCVVMSIYHTNKFLTDSGKGPVVALIAAIAMVFYSSSAFTAARHVFSDKGIHLLARIVFSTFLVSFGVFVIMYSVFSTTSVSYEQYRQRRTDVVKLAVTDDRGVQLNTERIAEKDKDIAAAVSDVAQYERESAEFRQVMSKSIPALSDDPASIESSKRSQQIAMNERAAASRNYDKSQTRLDTARDRLAKLREARYGLLDNKESAMDKAASQQSTAYTLVSSKLGMTEDTLQFVIYVIPAAFFDIVAPFAVAIVLLLKDRRNGKEVRKEKSSLLKLFNRMVDGIAKDKGATNV